MSFAEAVARELTEPQWGTLGKYAAVRILPHSYVDPEDQDRKEEDERASSRRRMALLATLGGLGVLGTGVWAANKYGWLDKAGEGVRNWIQGPAKKPGAVQSAANAATVSPATSLGIGLGLTGARALPGIGKYMDLAMTRTGPASRLAKLMGENAPLKSTLRGSPAPLGWLERFGKGAPGAAADIQQRAEAALKPLFDRLTPEGVKQLFRGKIADPEALAQQLRTGLAREIQGVTAGGSPATQASVLGGVLNGRKPSFVDKLAPGLIEQRRLGKVETLLDGLISGARQNDNTAYNELRKMISQFAPQTVSRTGTNRNAIIDLAESLRDTIRDTRNLPHGGSARYPRRMVGTTMAPFLGMTAAPWIAGQVAKYVEGEQPAEVAK